jgi:hypothetical protein
MGIPQNFVLEGSRYKSRFSKELWRKNQVNSVRGFPFWDGLGKNVKGGAKLDQCGGVKVDQLSM